MYPEQAVMSQRRGRIDRRVVHEYVEHRSEEEVDEGDGQGILDGRRAAGLGASAASF